MTPRALWTRRLAASLLDDGGLRGNGKIPVRREPTVEELNAALIHDFDCPFGDACTDADCLYRCEVTHG